MLAKLKPAVIGATGYSGSELARLLLHHPRVDTPLLLRRPSETNGEQSAGMPASFAGNGCPPLQPFSWTALQQHETELLFLATPHEASRSLVPEALAGGLRVIDLSGAWRLKQAQHRAIYGFKDEDAIAAAELTEKAVYGLPELNSDQIPSATVVANPGCYATTVILALAPLLKAGLADREKGIIADSKSGV